VLRVGLDLSRRRIDVCVISDRGELIDRFAATPDRDGLRGLARRVAVYGEPVPGSCTTSWSSTVGRCWSPTRSRSGGSRRWRARRTRLIRGVLAELSFRDLVPAIWLATFELRREREISRWRLQLVKRRSTLKNRVLSTLVTFGHQRHMSDLFGGAGRRLLGELEMPEPWRSHVDASLVLIDDLEARITQIAKELRRSGADHRYIPLLMTAPGFGWITSFPVACEIADISRFSSPVKLTGYTGLCPRVKQSGQMDHRSPLSKHGPRYLRRG